MDYQQLPSATTLAAIGGLSSAAVQSSHLQLMQNNPINNVQIITSMQPPPVPVNNNNIPLQVVHNLPHINGNSNNNNNNNSSATNNNNSNVQNNNHHSTNSQNLPPTSQLLQLHHHINNANNNNNNSTANNNNNNVVEEGNRWTQFQVQQLWRHHAYLNGMVFLDFLIRLFFWN